MIMRRLDDPFFPVEACRCSGHLPEQDGHRIYFEDSGNPDGTPIVLCHGGPGGSNAPGFRRLMDSQRCRIIQFDQRGCGQSEPAGELSQNSLQRTLDDMERLRTHLGVERWIVTGGSWGSTVALAYAEAHPDRCLALMLVSTWLCRSKDVHWWFQGVRTYFPELWEAFAALVPPGERQDLRRAYCQRILRGEADIASEAARYLYTYEEGFMHFDAPLLPTDPNRGERYGRIFAHYADNDFFLRENQLIEEADRLGNMPVLLVTGRYDSCTTPDNAYDLAQQLPAADLRIVAGAGHYPTERAMAVACIQACNDLLAMAQQQIARIAGETTCG